MTEVKSKSITVRDVKASDFIAAYSEVLKNNDKFVVPKWADLVKTGVHKELAPYDPDWYFVRAGINQFHLSVIKYIQCIAVYYMFYIL